MESGDFLANHCAIADAASFDYAARGRSTCPRRLPPPSRLRGFGDDGAAGLPALSPDDQEAAGDDEERSGEEVLDGGLAVEDPAQREGDGDREIGEGREVGLFGHAEGDDDAEHREAAERAHQDDPPEVAPGRDGGEAAQREGKDHAPHGRGARGVDVKERAGHVRVHQPRGHPVQRVEEGRPHGQEGRPLEAVAAGPGDEDDAHEADQHGAPADGAHAFLQQRHGERGHEKRVGVRDGGGGGEGDQRQRGVEHVLGEDDEAAAEEAELPLADDPGAAGGVPGGRGIEGDDGGDKGEEVAVGRQLLGVVAGGQVLHDQRHEREEGQRQKAEEDGGEGAVGPDGRRGVHGFGRRGWAAAWQAGCGGGQGVSKPLGRPWPWQKKGAPVGAPKSR